VASVLRGAVFVAFVAALTGCSGTTPDARPPAAGATMKASVDDVFERLAQGQLSRPEAGPVDGWQTSLPGGATVARSTLQSEARPLIALGADAVPHLVPWVHHDNAALRYVAIFTLEQITGERPQLGYFDADRAQQDAAIATWQRWYARRGG
jgi:hypothetical protein